MTMWRALIAWLLLCMSAMALAMATAEAGVLTKAMLEQKFPPPLMIGQKDDALPVWPVFKQNATANDLIGYLFESIDFVSIPGFSGVPVNLLIAIDPKGSFLDVQVISHHEPVFLDGLGEAPLHRFVAQYRGISLKDNIAIDTVPKDRADKAGGNVHLDGVAKATASVRIINQSVLSAALKVARKKLGYAGARDPDQIARVRQDLNETWEPHKLLASGLFKQVVFSNREIEDAYAGTPGEGLDPEALSRPDERFIDLHVAYVSVPTIGRSLLDDRSWRRLKDRLEEGDHALLVYSSGRYGPVSDTFTPGTVPDHLILSQGGLPMEMRDLNLDLTLRETGISPRGNLKVFRVISQAGLDPSEPLDLSLRVTRLKGMIYPERIGKDFVFHYRLPERFTVKPTSDNKSWVPVWKQRLPELVAVAIGLLILFFALALQKTMTAIGWRFNLFRLAYLAFMLFFLGWFAQGQLSIVHITSIAQALKEGRNLDFMLYDPLSVLLGSGVILSLMIWGRGTFCGWLCPFGALQEFIGKFSKWLKLPQLQVRASTDARLKQVKYLLLLIILGSVFISAPLVDKLVEIEPFKTAITLNFIRSWPFVLYAGGLLFLGAIHYKFFCRYLCPLGAGLAVLGRIRLFSWLPRRAQCGTPCQTCHYRCDYEAIRPDGAIRYDDCFQCMDCVVIYQSDDKCAPLIMEKKRRTVIAIRNVTAANAN